MPTRCTPVIRILSFGMALITLCCGQGDGERVNSERVGVVADPVVFGALSGASDDGTVLLSLPGEAYCTGVLIDANTVVTARHCVSELGTGIFACSPDGGLSLHAGAGGTFVRDREANEVAVFVGSKRPPSGLPPAARGRRVVTDGARTICGHDFAVVILDKALDSVTPVRVRHDVLRAGESVRIVGWGVDETGLPVTARRTRDGLIVSRLGPAPDNSPHASALTLGEFDFGESACDGDSGGAILDEAGELVGILSRGDGERREARGPECFGKSATNIGSSIRAHAQVIALALALQDDAKSQPPSCSGAARGAGSNDGATSGGGLAAIVFLVAAKLRRRDPSGDTCQR